MKFPTPKDPRGFNFDYIKKIIGFFKDESSKIRKSYLLMSKLERVLALLFLATAISVFSFRIYDRYIGATLLAPSNESVYTEIVVGDVHYLSPVLAANDAEKSISSLMFNGLVRVDKDNQPIGDLADHWDTSTDGKTYTFYLKNNLKFSDGGVLTASDVAYTISAIQTPEVQSPLSKSWIGVEVSVTDDKTLVINLPQAYGPFIYNCTFGVMPSYLSSDDFSKNLVGSGAFKFVKFDKKDNKTVKVELARNDNNIGAKPHIARLDFLLSSNPDDAVSEYKTNDAIVGIFGVEPGQGEKLDYQSSKKLALIFNLRKPKLADKAYREKIVSGASFDPTENISLTTLDAPLQKAKADELKAKFAAQNIVLDVKLLSALKLQDALASKDYELLLYGFDQSFDRDPYPFWHSSQLANSNFVGWSDKGSDILLEDARMMPDIATRNAKYDQFFAIVQSNFLAIFYDPISFNFSIKSDRIKGDFTISGSQAASRFDNIATWYSSEKRMRK